MDLTILEGLGNTGVQTSTLGVLALLRKIGVPITEYKYRNGDKDVDITVVFSNKESSFGGTTVRKEDAQRAAIIALEPAKVTLSSLVISIVT